MRVRLSLTQLRDIIQANPLLGFEESEMLEIRGVTTDSRSLQAGEIFVALRGETFDGHRFIGAAIERGAIATIVNSGMLLETTDDVPQLQVADSLVAYQKLGRWWRDRFEIPVIGITGSAGKTTTKELIAAVLSTRGNVLKTEKNYNNEIGVPKTLLQLTPEHEYAVVEMAMRAAGEIALLTEIARPTIRVIVNVGTAHIGRLGSEDAIARAKCELLATIPDRSIAILNADNARLMSTAASVWTGETITYGFENGDLRGKLLDSQTLEVDGMAFPLPLLGRHNASNYLAALAVAKVLGIDWQPLTAGLNVELPGGRSRRYTLPNDIEILDETYNAGLESMLAALELLKETPGQRHLAVLGTMKELGDKSARLHQRVGEKAKTLGLDGLFLLVDDPEAGEIATGAIGIPTECFTTHAELIQRLREVMKGGDRILFKASNSVGLNRVVKEIMNYEL
ncbi:UDP-N-acetylmuramoyl-tripeptide--D-alanyl-D-alanine ligase [Oscillatoria sp. FACHB-1406]|uniref:UDP-N-acetylmuramoyl-tripeptide--D-alanyl-D- alanine ligase n=1 Tax=Oscillatoria sp. FACHB-1406 TaxID=2692846 RepID=UPI0016896899|nr:UDP-N-acetylmuramoyl-tripeptide--D-alanyl-D-alanine ligase [Oscillatoria sp. FACHB-1406]MBD2578973.1 UDP-N-acetylmuramoyl-tripeptide--D-alanyl-D-alanine ligase [Oscillatoria sp. FACHB-1406]